MGKDTRKVREFCQIGKVGTLVELDGIHTKSSMSSCSFFWGGGYSV